MIDFLIGLGRAFLLLRAAERLPERARVRDVQPTDTRSGS